MHTLNNLDDSELSKIDKRTDGEVEVIDVKLNNRKTRKIGGKKDERWVVYSGNIEATKITSDWYLWIHHTIDKIPDKKITKFKWQKNHLENQSGTINRYVPTKIRKNVIKKKYETWK